MLARTILTTCMMATLLFAAAPASAQETCLGDTTGPFTPYTCHDLEDGSAFANMGPVFAGVNDAAARVTLGHPAGQTTVEIPLP